MKKYFILVFTLLIFSINLVTAQSSIEFVSPTWSQTITGETSANTIPVTITYTSQACTTSVCKGIAYIKLLVDDGTNNSITYSTENGGEIPNPLNLPSGEYEFTLYQYENYEVNGEVSTVLTDTDNVKFVKVKFTIKVETNVGGKIEYNDNGTFTTRTSGYEDSVFKGDNIALRTPDQEIIGTNHDGYYIWETNSEWTSTKFNLDEINVSYNRTYYHTVENDDNKVTFKSYLRYDEAPPAVPQNLSTSWVNGGEEDGNPRIDWTANTELDIDHYEIWKRIDNYFDPDVDWFLKTTTESNYYIDSDEHGWGTFGPPRNVYYKIKAVDLNDNKSSYSSSVMFVCDQELNKKASEQLVSGKPNSFKLGTNYPNPFNPTTNISYQLPKASNVTLKVYDVLGKEVIELVNENKSAGFYNVSFNASNLPSGLYFYKIQAGEFTETRKMLLMK